ncbi:MAG: hypothetical protein H0W58_14730 [Acidobacteria bacterium]|jgi:hypothetical protein|nr:hypothetical protein [Acidobacteriota bacterium]
MKSVSTFSILVLAFCIGTLAQTNETSSCPTISVTGPAEIPKPNEPVILIASIGEGAEKFNPQYKWTVRGGQIVEGQGTLILNVLQNNSGESLSATIEVIGLPKQCGNTATESLMCITPAPRPIQIDEISEPISQIDKARIDKIITALEDEPNAQLYVIAGFRKDTPQRLITREEQEIRNYLTKAEIEKDRIALIRIFTEIELTQFWLVPAGANPPEVK